MSITGIAVFKGIVTFASSYGANKVIKTACEAVVEMKDFTPLQKGCIAVGTMGLAGAAGKVAGDHVGKTVDNAVKTAKMVKKYFNSLSKEDEEDNEEKQDETEREVIEPEVVDSKEAAN